MDEVMGVCVCICAHVFVGGVLEFPSTPCPKDTSVSTLTGTKIRKKRFLQMIHGLLSITGKEKGNF